MSCGPAISAGVLVHDGDGALHPDDLDTLGREHDLLIAVRAKARTVRDVHHVHQVRIKVGTAAELVLGLMTTCALEGAIT